MPIEEEKEKMEESFRPDSEEEAEPRRFFKSMRPKGNTSNSDVPTEGLEVGGGTAVQPPTGDDKKDSKPVKDK